MLDNYCVDRIGSMAGYPPARILYVLDSMCVNCGSTQQVLNINNNLVNILIRAYVYIFVAIVIWQLIPKYL